MTNLSQRLITAFIAGPLFLLGMWTSPISRNILLAWGLLAGAAEFERLVSSKFPIKQHSFSRYISWFISLGYSAIWVYDPHPNHLLAWTALSIFLWIFESFRLFDTDQLFPWLAQQLFGSLYLGLWAGISFKLMTGDAQFSFIPTAPLLFVLFCIWMVDTMAYCFGRLMGKHKLAPVLSPKKTWEGAIGGTTCTIIFAAFVGPLMLNLSTASATLLGLLLAIAGQFGDLLESAQKRWAGIKDSSNLLPGHGGYLDRFDGFFLAAPLAVLILQEFGGLK